jgi:hypothetical protein
MLFARLGQLRTIQRTNVRAWLRTQTAGEIGMDVETILFAFFMIAIGAFVIC